MTAKADFNAEEWQTVVEVPMLAGVYTVAAGRGGTIRETIAMGQVYAEVLQAQSGGLIDEVAASPPPFDPPRLQQGGSVAELTRAKLTEALRILGEKATPEEVEAYKAFVLSVARAAAEAHKEGGFIGFGGKQVSPEEQAALDEIEQALAGA
jgi:hypothetical protein